MKTEVSFMPSRRFSLSAALLPTLGLALLFASSMVPAASEDRGRLGAAVLAQSRGANPKFVLTQYACLSFDGSYACSIGTIGNPCTACTDPTFIDLQMGSNGGYTGNGTTVGCGQRVTGVCDGLFQCSIPLTVVGTCNTPPKVVVQ